MNSIHNHRPLLLLLALIAVLTVLVPYSPQASALQTTTLDETCPAFVSEALTRLNTTCQNLGRNSLCYGHNLVSVEFTREVSEDVFDQPSDQTELVNVRNVITAPLDEALGQWGLALIMCRRMCRGRCRVKVSCLS